MSSIIGLNASAIQSAASHKSSNGELVKDGDTASFMQDVIEASQSVPILVDFWASWCGPCQTLGPIIEEVIKVKGGAVKLVKIDSDANQQLSAQMGVRSLPTVIAFAGGQPVDGFMGALPRAQVIAFVDKVINEHAENLTGSDSLNSEELDLTEMLSKAALAMSEGDLDSATALYGQAYSVDPSNLDALAGLGKTLISTGDIEAAKELVEGLEEETKNAPEINGFLTMVRLADEAAEMMAKAAEFESIIQADENNLDAKFNLAIARFGSGKRDEGLSLLLDIIKINREWNDSAAQKKLLEYMAAYGAKDPFSIQARKALSAVLFS